MTTKYTDMMEWKIPLVIKDLETAYTAHSRHAVNINLMRNLTITLILAYFGFLFTVKPFNVYAGIPIIFLALMFIILETLEKSFMLYLASEITLIQNIFMIENHEEFRDEIRKYQFREMRQEWKEWNIMRKHFRNSLKSVHSLIWYTFLACLYIIYHVLWYFR